ncbi:hypothetical protein MNBD_BACTEROID03-2617 [hydrothermal vent metagenome]|uniref:Uncharacterized protein n=1 Tax=hydrothermal vent metagenome TaxID=652676 RepID=A0A3B0TE29_9ZZZZ
MTKERNVLIVRVSIFVRMEKIRDVENISVRIVNEVLQNIPVLG